MEHHMQGIGWSGPEKGTLRIRCSCGWTEKIQGGLHSVEHDEQMLKLYWERHVYTPEERLLIHELAEPDCDICRREQHS